MCSWSQTNASDDTSALHSGGGLCVSSGHVIYPTPTPSILGQNRTKGTEEENGILIVNGLLVKLEIKSKFSDFQPSSPSTLVWPHVLHRICLHDVFEMFELGTLAETLSVTAGQWLPSQRRHFPTHQRTGARGTEVGHF